MFPQLILVERSLTRAPYYIVVCGPSSIRTLNAKVLNVVGFSLFLRRSRLSSSSSAKMPSVDWRVPMIGGVCVYVYACVRT